MTPHEFGTAVERAIEIHNAAQTLADRGEHGSAVGQNAVAASYLLVLEGTPVDGDADYVARLRTIAAEALERVRHFNAYA